MNEDFNGAGQDEDFLGNLFILLFLIRGRREEEEEEREKKKRNGFIFFNLIETIVGKSTHAEIFFLVKLFLEESDERKKINQDDFS